MSRAQNQARQVAAPQQIAHDQLRARFLDRGKAALQNLADRLDTRELNEALAARSDATALLTALTQPGAIGMFQTNALTPARLRGVRARDEILAAEGGTLGAEEVGKLLRTSVQSVEKRRASGELLALEIPRRGHCYPAWQFVDGSVLPGMEESMKLLADHPPLAQMRFFLSGNHRLGGERPLDLLRRGEEEPVQRAARSFGEQGAA